MKSQKIVVEFTQAEGLVLLEWLLSVEDKKLPFQDDAEQIILWKLEGRLEKQVLGIFSPCYAENIAQAREEVRNGPND